MLPIARAAEEQVSQISSKTLCPFATAVASRLGEGAEPAPGREVWTGQFQPKSRRMNCVWPVR